MKTSDLDTPAVVIDLDVMDRNLRRMADYCASHQINLRPHTKTHKIPEIARRQVELGAKGITVAKLGEAEVMVESGLDNILIAYPIVGELKLRRLIALARRARIIVALDSLEVARDISAHAARAGARIGVLLEFNTGFRRCGLTVSESSVDVAKRIHELPGLEWRGIMVYPGHIMANARTRPELIAAENQVISKLMALIESVGIKCAIVSGGNTPAAFSSHEFIGLTEIRPGTYIFNDKNTVCAEAANWADCAARVLTTVVSTSVPGRAIIDAGSKTLTSDRLESGDGTGYGYVCDYADVAIEELSEEHGHLGTRDCARPPRVGDRLQIVPNHICPVMNLHDVVYGIQGEDVVCEWNVAARGKVK